MTQNLDAIRENIGKFNYIEKQKLPYGKIPWTKSKENWKTGKKYLQHISQIKD